MWAACTSNFVGLWTQCGAAYTLTGLANLAASHKMFRFALLLAVVSLMLLFNRSSSFSLGARSMTATTSDAERFSGGISS